MINSITQDFDKSLSTNYEPEGNPVSKRSRTKQLIATISTSNWASVGENGWDLPSTVEPHFWCGQWSWEGCLNVAKHGSPKQFTLDGNHAGKIWVRHYQKCCYRASCKVCFEKWINREANAITRRLERGLKQVHRKYAVHIVVSPPSWDYGLDHKAMRKRAYKCLKAVGVEAGCTIFHPFRYNQGSNLWYWSPHFHIMGVGWIEGVGELYKKQGWIVKNLGIRKSSGEMFATVQYELSHAGIKQGLKTVTWFGKFTYSKLSKEKLEVKHLCPICKAQLVPIKFLFALDRPPPEKEFEMFADKNDFVEIIPDVNF